MAIIYSQNWAAGPSAYLSGPSGSFFETTGWGGTDAPDGTYPELKHAEEAKVVVGTGPSGENVLDATATNKARFTGVGLAAFGPNADGSWNAQRGKITFVQKWDYTAESTFFPLAWVAGVPASNPQQFSILAPSLVPYFLVAMEEDAGDWYVTSRYAQANGTSGVWTSSITDGSPFDISGLLGTWVTTQICWQCGVAGSPTTPYTADATGLFKVTLNGVERLSVSGIRLMITSWNTNTTMKGRGLGIGFVGLIGPMTNFILYDDGCTLTGGGGTTTVGTTSTRCCTHTPQSGSSGGSATGPILPPVTPTWTPACTGGGSVDSASNPTDDENWAA